MAIKYQFHRTCHQVYIMKQRTAGILEKERKIFFSTSTKHCKFLPPVASHITIHLSLEKEWIMTLYCPLKVFFLTLCMFWPNLYTCIKAHAQPVPGPHDRIQHLRQSLTDTVEFLCPLRPIEIQKVNSPIEFTELQHPHPLKASHWRHGQRLYTLSFILFSRFTYWQCCSKLSTSWMEAYMCLQWTSHRKTSFSHWTETSK